MSLFRLPSLAARSSPVVGRRCVRCVSSFPPSPPASSSPPSAGSPAAPKPMDILDVLPTGRSPAQRHPSAPNQRDPSRLSPMSLARKALPAKASITPEQMRDFARSEDYSKQMFRRWTSGTVYAPHDLTGTEQKKWKRGRSAPQIDAFDVLGINPINAYKNYTIMSEFMTEMGRIKHSKLTGLRPVNQRKIAKAIRRAIGLGLMPSVHRHPLVLKNSSPARFIS